VKLENWRWRGRFSLTFIICFPAKYIGIILLKTLASHANKI
jgi:hypothetical protein